MTATEVEEQTVRKRRAEGTPCNKENFEIWRQKFAKEMAEKEAEEEAIKAESAVKKQKEKVVDKTGRITGFLHFSGKAGKNLEEMERAAEEAEIDPDELDVDEDLFDLEDDEDLDDLDFDDDEDDDGDEYDEDDDEEPDI
jgi:gluconate kinase